MMRNICGLPHSTQPVPGSSSEARRLSVRMRSRPPLPERFGAPLPSKLSTDDRRPRPERGVKSGSDARRPANAACAELSLVRDWHKTS